MRIKTPDGHLRGVLLWVGPQGSGKTTLLRVLQNTWCGSNAQSLVIADESGAETSTSASRTKAELPARGLVHLDHLTKMSESEVRRLKAWVSGADSPFSGTVGDRLLVLEATLDSASSSPSQTSDWLRFVGRHIPVLWLEHLDAILTFAQPSTSERRRIAEDMLAKLQAKALQSGIRITWESTLPVEAVGLCPEAQARWGLRWRIEERLEQELAGQLLQVRASGNLNLKVVVQDGSLKLVRSEIPDQA
jgi:ATP-dependent Clp protease ATP-binding subunit ClpA